MDFEKLNAAIRPLDRAAMARAAARWNELAKPVGSLGRFEALVTQMAGIFGTERIDIKKRAALVFCADNGVIKRGVAMTPPEITAVMSRFIAEKRSSVGLLCKAAGADVFAVDMGMFTAVDAPGLINCRIARGTRDMTEGPAMTRAQAEEAIQTGMALVRLRVSEGYRLIATGEMGIGNTTTTAAVSSVLLGSPVSKVTGRGVGLSDAGLKNKIAVIERAIAINRPDASDALDVLSKLGGFDMAAMAGAFLGGALYRVPVIIDGVISAAAALIAKRLCPAAGDFMLPSHRSAEPAGGLLLEELGLAPLVAADMRLGEGTGAVMLFPLLDMALSVYDTLITYADIGME